MMGYFDLDDERRLKVIIAGGGTGGHIYPGIAIAKEILKREKQASILWVGGDRGLEGRIVPREGFPLKTIHIRGLLGKSVFSFIKGLALLPLAFFETIFILLNFRPHLVIGVGGYASGPVVLISALSGKRTMIAEQNLKPGITNRILSFFVDLACCSFEDTARFFHCPSRITGNPIREEFSHCGEERRDEGRKVLLIFGGSQGAKVINRAMIEALSELEPYRDRLIIMHQTGEADFSEVEEAYRRFHFTAEVAPFFFDMPERYSRAHLVISRAGASTVAELTACGRAAILIPLARAASAHQLMNARALSERGAAVVIEEKDLSGSRLSREIISLINDDEKLRSMEEKSRALGKRRAASQVAEFALSLVSEGKGV